MYFTQDEKTAILGALALFIFEAKKYQSEKPAETEEHNNKGKLQEKIAIEQLIQNCETAMEKIKTDIDTREKNSKLNTQNPKEWMLSMPEFQETVRNICYFFNTLKYKCYPASIIMWNLQEVCKKNDIDIKQFYHDLSYLAAKEEELRYYNEKL